MKYNQTIPANLDATASMLRIYCKAYDKIPYH